MCHIRNEGFFLEDVVLEGNLYFFRGRITGRNIIEFGGIKNSEWSLFVEQEIASAVMNNWLLGLWSQEIFATGVRRIKVGPLVGRKLSTARIILWPWRDTVEWSSYGLVIQGKMVFNLQAVEK